MDFITDLPPYIVGNKEVNLILVIVNRFTKINLYVPTTKRYISVELTVILRDEVVRKYSVPRGIIIDRGSVFIS